MSFEAHLARLWRRRFLIAAVTLLAGLVAFGATVRHSGTRYTGTATLITVTQSGSPDQTAILASGYVGMFIQPSFQRMLHAKLGLPADVSLTAQTSAQSPIIFISATSPDEATAQLAAADAADEFLREVNANLQASRENLIAQMRRAVDADTRDVSGVYRVPAKQDMQNLINAVNANPTNDLQVLQSDAGVTAKSSGAERTIAVALVGGLIFGCLLAWVLGAASRRLSSPAELMEKARIEPLVVIPPGGGTRAELQRERQLRQLAATVALLDVPKPAVVAVAAVERTPGADEIAESLARYRADHGARTVLVHADGAPAPLDAVEGDIESVAVRWLLVSSESGGRMREVFPVGDPAGCAWAARDGAPGQAGDLVAEQGRPGCDPIAGGIRVGGVVYGLRRCRSDPTGRRRPVVCGFRRGRPGPDGAGRRVPARGGLRGAIETALRAVE